MSNGATFPPNLGGSGNTYTDDKDPTTGLNGGGHRDLWIPMLLDIIAMAQTSSTKAGQAAGSAATASEKATQTGEDRTAVADDRAAVQTLRNESASFRDQAAASQAAAADSETASANSASTAGTAESGAVAAAASAEADADRAEAAAQGLLGRRTVVSTSAENIPISDQDSGTHYRGTRATRQEYQLDPDAALGMTIHVQARGTGLISFDGGLIRSRGGRKHITEQDGVVTATKTAETEWTLAGDLGDVQTQLSDYELADGSNYQLSDGSTYQATTVAAS